MSTTSPQQYDRVALDAAAVVQSLSRCAAEFQAKAVAQRGLVAAATSRGLSELAAQASLLVECYEDAAARVFQTIQNIITGQQGDGAGAASTEREVASAAPAAPTTLQSHCDAVSPSASRLCRRAESDKVSPSDRYGALVGLVRELTTTAEHPKLEDVKHTALLELYRAICDKLPGLEDVGKALRDIEADWRKADSTLQPDVRRSDWFKKMYLHIANLTTMRSNAPNAPITLLDDYTRLVDVVVANMATQQWPGGAVGAMVEATTKELRRLRADLGVVVAIGQLKA